MKENLLKKQQLQASTWFALFAITMTTHHESALRMKLHAVLEMDKSTLKTVDDVWQKKFELSRFVNLRCFANYD
jgi:hypothetical protein